MNLYILPWNHRRCVLILHVVTMELKNERQVKGIGAGIAKRINKFLEMQHVRMYASLQVPASANR